MAPALDDWFIREILVYEATLVHYLLRCWPHRDEVPDLRQEIYARVYEAAGKARPGQGHADDEPQAGAGAAVRRQAGTGNVPATPHARALFTRARVI